jgi:hypothetical protein
MGHRFAEQFRSAEANPDALLEGGELGLPGRLLGVVG